MDHALHHTDGHGKAGGDAPGHGGSDQNTNVEMAYAAPQRSAEKTGQLSEPLLSEGDGEA